MAAITSILSVGIAFYVRFLAALCKESNRRWIGYWVRIEPGEGGDTVLEPEPEPESAFREETPVDLQCV